MGAMYTKRFLMLKKGKTGITIHYVSEEEYDEGAVINSLSQKILPEDTIETIEKKVRHLELLYFVEVVEGND